MRTISVKLNIKDTITITETEDGARVTADHDNGLATVSLTSEQLWRLGEEILAMFDAKGLRREEVLAKIDATLERNESRCLDDEIDRGVVARALVKELALCP